jgi:hypothetical protein
MMSLSITDKPSSTAVISDLLIMPMGDGNAPLVVNIARRS